MGVPSRIHDSPRRNSFALQPNAIPLPLRGGELGAPWSRSNRTNESNKRTIITAASNPPPPWHVKLRRDEARDRGPFWRRSGARRRHRRCHPAAVRRRAHHRHLAEELARAYNAPKAQILADVVAMLQDLADKGVCKRERAGADRQRLVGAHPCADRSLAELTHRCPLQCPYRSNPLALENVAGELPTEIWVDVSAQAAALGVLQLHLSGGEPTVRRDLEQIVAAAPRRPRLQPDHGRLCC